MSSCLLAKNIDIQWNLLVHPFFNRYKQERLFLNGSCVKMSDRKKGKEIQEIYRVDSDQESSNVQDCDVTTQKAIQDIPREGSSKQFENVVDGNGADITNSSKAPEMLQTKEIGKEAMPGSLMPHESVQAPANELPRNNEKKADITSAAVSRPPKRRCRRSTGGISINTEVTEVAEHGGPRRSSRIQEQNEAKNDNFEYGDPYFFITRPLYMVEKREEYIYLGEDSEFEDDDSD